MTIPTDAAHRSGALAGFDMLGANESPLRELAFGEIHRANRRGTEEIPLEAVPRGERVEEVREWSRGIG